MTDMLFVSDINTAPNITNLPSGIVVPENSAPSTTLYILEKTDVNSLDTHTWTYSISSGGSVYFAVDSCMYFIYLLQNHWRIHDSSSNTCTYKRWSKLPIEMKFSFCKSVTLKQLPPQSTMRPSPLRNSTWRPMYLTDRRRQAGRSLSTCVMWTRRHLSQRRHTPSPETREQWVFSCQNVPKLSGFLLFIFNGFIFRLVSLSGRRRLPSPTRKETLQRIQLIAQSSHLTRFLGFWRSLVTTMLTLASLPLYPVVWRCPTEVWPTRLLLWST